jgi:hypothetical protein
MKIYRDGGAFAHDGQDVVAALDAFKIIRHGGAGSAARWEVHALTPWARDMMASAGAYRTMIGEGGGPTRALNDAASDTIAQMGVSFSRKRDAESFCKALENMAERWPDTQAGKVDDMPYSVGVTETCERLGRFKTEDHAAVFIGTLPDHEAGIYYLDGPER